MLRKETCTAKSPVYARKGDGDDDVGNQYLRGERDSQNSKHTHARQ